MSTPPQIRRVRANGIDLAYETFGDPSAPPLLLVMGLATQMVVWDDDLCAMFAARGFSVIRFDNRDIGLSTHLDSARRPSTAELMLAGVTRRGWRVPYLLRDMAADTAALLDALGIASAHVTGISMGGMIAQELAIRFPARVRTLTSIMSSTGARRLPGPTREALAVLTQRTPHDRASFLRAYVATWRVLAGNGFPFDEARMRRHGEISYDRGINPAGAARQLYAIMVSGDRTRALGGVRIPSLVIHGTNDPLVPVPAGHATARAIPGARLMLIDGMGHTLPVEVWPRLVDAIAQHESGTTARPMEAR